MAIQASSKILASDVSGAIKSITREGTTFTYTCLNGSTGTFTQQDNNTTYSAGTGISISSNKISNTGVTSVNGSTGAVTISAGITTVKGQIGSAVASNTTSLTLPSGGTWFVWNTTGDGTNNKVGVGTASGNSSTGWEQDGKVVSGNTTVYAKKYLSNSQTYSDGGKLAAVRIE